MAEVTSSTAIDGVLVVDPVVYADDRGLFVETWRQEWLGNVPPMVQGNRADRVAGTVVGLHYHCLLYTSPSPRDGLLSRMPSSA